LLWTEDKNVGAYTTNFLDYSIPLGYTTVSLDKQFLMFPRDVMPLIFIDLRYLIPRKMKFSLTMLWII
jgi:hypothetical protein